jgi:COMPASS component SWD1
MNLQLLNPFAHESFPERVDVSIDANAQCVRFNAGSSRFAGSYIAIGRVDGCVGILDLDTRAYLRFLEGHVKAVTSLWSVKTCLMTSVRAH